MVRAKARNLLAYDPWKLDSLYVVVTGSVYFVCGIK